MHGRGAQLQVRTNFVSLCTENDYNNGPTPLTRALLFAAGVAQPTPGASGCATCQGGLHLRDELASSSLRDSHRGPRVLPQHSIDVPRFPSRASGASSALYRRAGHFVVPRFPSWAPGAFAALYRTSPAGNQNCSILRWAIFPSQNRVLYQDAACAAKALPERAVTTVRNIFFYVPFGWGHALASELFLSFALSLRLQHYRLQHRHQQHTPNEQHPALPTGSTRHQLTPSPATLPRGFASRTASPRGHSTRRQWGLAKRPGRAELGRRALFWINPSREVVDRPATQGGEPRQI